MYSHLDFPKVSDLCMLFLINKMMNIILNNLSFICIGHNIGFPSKQKSDVWNMIALESSDQLRQRMAWALSQILVITSSQVNSYKLLSLIIQMKC